MSRKSVTLKGYSSGERIPLGDPPATPKHISKKNTRRWCKGKTGQEHDVKLVPSYELHAAPNTPQNVQKLALWKKQDEKLAAEGRRPYGSLLIKICTRCGRHLGWEDNRNDRA